ncbi:NAD-binding protein [Cytobacillus oceanisediminis]|uniref:NAD-binding protein n=1 Tax=Cytobacillus oceanisediminis TaxID=665099 RepID=UPI003D2F9293
MLPLGTGGTNFSDDFYRLRVNPFCRATLTVIIGWNERAKQLIEILTVISPAKISIIDYSIKKLPISLIEVVHIKGHSMHDRVLEEAGIKKASLVFITSDMHSTEHKSDSSSIIIFLAIKSLNPSAFTVVEILSDTNINNAKRE